MASATPSVDDDFVEEKKKRRSVKGRQLMRWNPDEDQFVLLVIDKVCVEQGISIPWDSVAKEIEPFLTGEAIKQHLAKVRHFREQAGRRVPEKLDKSARRKTGKLANAGTTTPAKRGRVGKIKTEGGDDDLDDTPTKGASLLWQGPVRKPKTPKNGGNGEAATPKTPVTGRGGRKKVKAENAGGDNEPNTNNLGTPTTGKRGRKPKKEVSKDELEQSDNESPNKKQKLVEGNSIGLRPAKQHVNYKDHYDSDEDIFDARQEGDDDDNDENYEDEEQAQMAIVKQENDPSQGTTVYDHPPPPPPAFAAVAHPGFYQDYPPYGVADYTSHATNIDYGNPFDMQGHGGFNGLPPFSCGPSMMVANLLSTFPAGPDVSFQQANGGHVMGQNNFGTFNGNNGYGMGTPQQQGHVFQPQEQVSRTSLPTVPEELPTEIEEIQHDKKPQVNRKNSSPKEKKTQENKAPEKKSPKKRIATQKSGQSGENGVLQKIESEVSVESTNITTSNDHFQGDIPIMNATGVGNAGIHNLDFPNSMNGNTLHLQTNVDLYGDMAITASPDDYIGGGNQFMGASAHAHPAPVYNNHVFDNQAMHPVLSHNSSFESSVPGSQSNEAMQGGIFHPSQLMEQHLNYGPFDAVEYEQMHPDDQFVNLGGFLGDDLHDSYT